MESVFYVPLFYMNLPFTGLNLGTTGYSCLILHEPLIPTLHEYTDHFLHEGPISISHVE